LTPLEIAGALGTPMAFVEEIINKLVEAQLMKREGTKVFTDFVIVSRKDNAKALKAAQTFAHTHFDAIHSIVSKMVSQYEEIPGFSAFNNTQKYMCAALSMRHYYTTPITEAVIKGDNPMYEQDYPERPNYGKWIAIGGRFPHGFNFDESKHAISGRLRIDDINENVSSLREWSTNIGPTHNAKFKHHLTYVERAKLLDDVRTNTLTAFQSELLPDFERYGFIKDENGTKALAVPFISAADEKTFSKIEKEGGSAFCTQLQDKAVELCKANKIKYPKRITAIPNNIISCMAITDLPMCYIYEAAERGLITIEDGKNYPVMFLVQ